MEECAAHVGGRIGGGGGAHDESPSASGPSAKAGKIGEPGDDEGHADDEDDELRAVGRKRSVGLRRTVLPSQRSGQCQHHHHRNEATQRHDDAQRGVVEGGVGIEPGESTAVVVTCRREGVEHLA